MKVVDAVDKELSKKAIYLKDFTLNNQPTKQSETAEIIELKSSLMNLEKLPANAAIDEAIIKIKLQIQQHQIKNINQTAFQIEQVKEFVQVFSDTRFYKNMKESVKNKLYKKFIKSVTILGGEVVTVDFVQLVC